MRIVVDRQKCAMLGICESVSPDFFEITDDGELRQLAVEVPEERLEELTEAVAGCPTEALRLVP